jgi:hypothetical protein
VRPYLLHPARLHGDRTRGQQSLRAFARGTGAPRRAHPVAGERGAFTASVEPFAIDVARGERAATFVPGTVSPPGGA